MTFSSYKEPDELNFSAINLKLIGIIITEKPALKGTLFASPFLFPFSMVRLLKELKVAY